MTRFMDIGGNKTVVDEHNLPVRRVVEAADNVDGIAPAGLDIMTTCFIVEKMGVAVCDGRDKWYASVGGIVKSISAGQPWSDLFG